MIDLSTLGTVTSPFGYRGDIGVAGATSDHMGMDIVLKNSQIPSITGGTVIDRGFNTSRGNYVTIRGQDGYTMTYMHMASPSPLSKGLVIPEGQTVGTMGSTGISSGAHVHIGIKDAQGKYVNPATYMSGGSSNNNQVFTPLTPMTPTSNGLQNAGKSLMGTVVKAIAIILLVVAAAFLFFQAFDIKVF